MNTASKTRRINLGVIILFALKVNLKAKALCPEIRPRFLIESGALRHSQLKICSSLDRKLL
jgi:hypothetical protein